MQRMAHAIPIIMINQVRLLDYYNQSKRLITTIDKTIDSILASHLFSSCWNTQKSFINHSTIMILVASNHITLIVSYLTFDCEIKYFSSSNGTIQFDRINHWQYECNLISTNMNNMGWVHVFTWRCIFIG
jgi:hypothetical protein